MSLLTVTASLDDGHDDVLGRHEGQLLGDAARDDFGVDDETFGHVLESREYDVGGKEYFGERDAPVRTGKTISYSGS